uniref:Ig-like domain-containing protein n=1 Tax=Pygocentrus nattereri TaxID=42514 RepID=A0AAR2J9E3_PYGNA
MSLSLSLDLPVGCVCGSDLTVWQTPEIINTTEGQHVNISCHFTVKSTWEGLKVEWWRNNKTEVKQELFNISALNSINPESMNHSSVLQIPSVRLNHSGIYYCAVFQELPMLGEKVYGPGTELRVGELLYETKTAERRRGKHIYQYLNSSNKTHYLISMYKIHAKFQNCAQMFFKSLLKQVLNCILNTEFN